KKRRAFGVTNNMKLFFIRDGAERRNSGENCASRRLQADGRGNGDACSSVGTGPETDHDRFRGTMLAHDFIERSKKWSGGSAIVRPIRRAQNSFFVGQRDRTAPGGQIEGEQFHSEKDSTLIF